ncbi:MAG TPA: bL34 family ribosomal protein [Phycisphaerae bacterium]|nr:bL34 family ribosomal protein [Phycisphaerae bacterium]
MHYPKRISKITRRHRHGFRSRMRTTSGRRIISRKRRLGRRVNVV